MRFSISAVALATLAVLSAPAAAQSCSDLTVAGNGAPGTTLTFSIAGAPAGAPTVILAGFGGTGSTPNPIIDLGILPPFVPIGGGLADASGALSTAIDIPAMLTHYISGHAQGVSIQITLPQPPFTRPLPSLFSFCTSDVEAFSAGNAPTN